MENSCNKDPNLAHNVDKALEKTVTMNGNREEDSDSDDEAYHPNVAPTNLLMEFLASIMEKDYESADKLCKMILMYEPKNAEALKFQPLITEKLQLMKEEAEHEGESGDETEDGDTTEADDTSDESENESSSAEEEATSPENTPKKLPNNSVVNKPHADASKNNSAKTT